MQYMYLWDGVWRMIFMEFFEETPDWIDEEERLFVPETCVVCNLQECETCEKIPFLWKEEFR